MDNGIFHALKLNFLGSAPRWYKGLIIAYLIINPILFTIDPFVAGWVLIAEFISTLALALICYPLPSGGLLAIEAVIIGMTNTEHVYHHVVENFPVLLLLMFMVAGIFFMKELLLFIFTRLLVSVKSKLLLSLVFSFMGAFLSAFLDALTVTAVVITVAYGFYGIFHKYAGSRNGGKAASIKDDSTISGQEAEDLEGFRAFLRNLMMHAAVGTALGGAVTLVGEPQNLIIGKKMGWDFIEFFIHCSHVSIPVLVVGLLTCIVTEKFHILSYGAKLPDNVRKVLEDDIKQASAEMNNRKKARLIIQALVGVFLIVALAFHWAEVGLIGLSVIVLLTAFTGVIEEHHFGEAFTESLPFTALLVVFFTIVSVIADQQLFKGIMDWVFTFDGSTQIMALFWANGILSAISDNVFVATVYITEVENHYRALAGCAAGVPCDYVANLSSEQLKQFYDTAVAINMGTNIPSVATPNGQAAFLFLLTSTLAPLIRLSYVQMLKLALPYTITMTIMAALATHYFQ